MPVAHIILLPSKVTVGTIPTTSGYDFSPKSIVFDWGRSTPTTITFLSRVMEIDWSNDDIRLAHLGPMMGIDRVSSHHLIGMDWAQNQSKIEIKLITLI